MNSRNHPKEIEKELISYTGHFIKENLGRGPKDIEIKFLDNVFVLFIKGILFPMEKNILASEEGKSAILRSRGLYLNKTNEKRLSTYEQIVGAKVMDHYDGWNLENDSAVSVVIFDRNIF